MGGEPAGGLDDVVVEHTQADQLSRKPFDVIGVVALFNAKQNEQSVPDGGFGLPADGDGCRRDSLDDGAHGVN
jgi:hypothetical protein